MAVATTKGAEGAALAVAALGSPRVSESNTRPRYWRPHLGPIFTEAPANAADTAINTESRPFSAFQKIFLGPEPHGDRALDQRLHPTMETCRQSAAKLLTKDEARRIAAKVAVQNAH